MDIYCMQTGKTFVFFARVVNVSGKTENDLRKMHRAGPLKPYNILPAIKRSFRGP